MQSEEKLIENQFSKSNQEPPPYSEYPPCPQMSISIPSNDTQDLSKIKRNQKDEKGRPIICPRGGQHEWEESYASYGYCLSVCCFPCGIYCCQVMKDAKCKKCGYLHEAFPNKPSKPDSEGEMGRKLGFAIGYLTA